MIEALPFLIKGAVIGLSAAGLPGPLMTYLITETLNHGWRKSYKIVFAPLISDIVIVPLVVLLLKQLPEGFLKSIHFAGAALLLYMAYGIWKSLEDRPNEEKERNTKISGLNMAVLLNFVSPGPYLFWSLVNGPILLEALDQSILSGVSFVAAFYTIFILGMLVVVYVFNSARNFGPKVVKYLTYLSLVILVFFAVSLVGQGISY